MDVYLKLAGAALALALLSGCKETVASTPEAAAPAAAPVAATAPGPTLPSLPQLPDWVTPYKGAAAKDLFSLLSGESQCLGWFERRGDVYADGAQYEGWGWNVGSRAPYARVLVTDQFGVVVGGGESGITRADVVQAVPAIKDPKVGFTVLAQAPPGPMIAYGLDETAKTACELGRYIPAAEPSAN